ncbi:hypothetical protein J1N35_001570, partial [Gossypium stocksii]
SWFSNFNILITWFYPIFSGLSGLGKIKTKTLLYSPKQEGFTFKEQETSQQLIGIEQLEFRIKRHTSYIWSLDCHCNQ